MGKRSLADWTWLVIGIAGVVCIGIAVYLFVKGSQEPSPEEVARDRAARARQDWDAGREKLRDGDHRVALDHLLAAVRAPELEMNPGLHNDLGIAFLGAGEEQKALAAWSNARNLSPTYHEPYLHLGTWYRGNERPEEALHHFRAGLAFHPGPVPPDLPKLVTELEKAVTEEFAKTQVELAKRFAANPADVAAFAGLILLRLRVTESPEDAPAADGIRQAVLAAGKGLEDLEGLRARQHSAVGDRPGSVVDRAGLAAVELLRGDLERAGTVFGEALALSEADPMSLLGVAVCDLLTGAESEARMETAARTLSRSPLPWIVLGAGCVAHGKAEQARQALINAVRLNPAIPDTCRLFAATFTTPENQDKRDAFLKAYRRLLE
jgi:tetratricopeptide (TPR) repeat protein